MTTTKKGTTMTTTKTKPTPTQHAGPITDPDQFHDWTAHSFADVAEYTTCSPNLVELLEYLVPLYGLQRLGCHGVRAIRGGTRTSAHAAGAATDVRYMPAVPDPALREICVNQLIPFIIEHHDLLGVQAIHDYYACRIWRAGRGWKPQTPSATGMGQKWAGWLHIETHPNQWGNATPILERLGLVSGHPLPPFDPANRQFGLYPQSKTKAKIRRGARGDLVRYAQAIVGSVVDGAFGPQTDMLTRVWQAARGLESDGIIGPKTWKAIDDAARALTPA